MPLSPTDKSKAEQFFASIKSATTEHDDLSPKLPKERKLNFLCTPLTSDINFSLKEFKDEVGQAKIVFIYQILVT